MYFADGIKPSTLQDLLSSNIAAFNKSIKTQPGLKALSEAWKQDESKHKDTSDVSTWTFVKHVLKCLRLLCDSIQRKMAEYNSQESNKKTGVPEISPDTLSFHDQKIVSDALQFVICLGICPYLAPGVGVPLDLRSSFAAMVKATLSLEPRQEADGDIRLFQCIQVSDFYFL